MPASFSAFSACAYKLAAGFLAHFVSVPVNDIVLFCAVLSARRTGRCRAIYLACLCFGIFISFLWGAPGLAAYRGGHMRQSWRVSGVTPRCPKLSFITAPSNSGRGVLCRCQPDYPSVLCDRKPLYTLACVFCHDRGHWFVRGLYYRFSRNSGPGRGEFSIAWSDMAACLCSWLDCGDDPVICDRDFYDH